MRKFINLARQLVETVDLNEGEIPETTYGYWITDQGEFITVAEYRHYEAVIQTFGRQADPLNYNVAFSAGWIRIVAKTPSRLMFAFNPAFATPRAMRAFKRLCRQSAACSVTGDTYSARSNSATDGKWFNNPTSAVAWVVMKCQEAKFPPVQESADALRRAVDKYLIETPIMEAAVIPETDYGYWITADGEYIVVRHEDHQRTLMRMENDLKSYTDAYQAGWIRVVTAGKVYGVPGRELVFALCRDYTGRKALSSLRNLTRNPNFVSFRADMYGRRFREDGSAFDYLSVVEYKSWDEPEPAMAWCVAQCREAQAKAAS